MAVTKIWKVVKRMDHVIGYAKDENKTKIEFNQKYEILVDDLQNVIDYARNSDKTEKEYFVTGINCDSDSAYEEMQDTKRYYNKKDKILAFHAYQSFAEGEVTPELAHQIGVQLANEMWGDRFQVVVTTHLNTNHIHNHIVLNSVSFEDGLKYYDNHTNYAKMNFVDPSAAATAEVMADIIKEMNVKIDNKIAECIYTGISTDTGCFKYSNATPKTYRIAADMIELGARSAFINRLMFDTKSKKRVELEKLVLETLEFFCNDKCAVVYVTHDMQVKSGTADDDIEGISSIPRGIEGVQVGVTLREKENGIFKISLRTNDELNASDICKKFGGGGHPAAAGCTIHGGLENAKKSIVEAISDEIKRKL